MWCDVCDIRTLQTESLTQVYGILHELLDQNVVKLDTLSKYKETHTYTCRSK